MRRCSKMFANIHLCREARFCSRASLRSAIENLNENLASSNIYSRLMAVRLQSAPGPFNFASCRIVLSILFGALANFDCKSC